MELDLDILLLIAVVAGTASTSDLHNENVNQLKSFKHCLRQAQEPSLGRCIGRSALNFIQRFDEQDNFTVIADFVSTKDDKVAARSLANVLDTDPVDFRGILENAGAVFSQRSMQWHMDTIYPGLMLKLGPTADSNSVAEFVLDSAVSERHFNFQEPSTARILTKQYLLPFLLGLKFNLVALVPLLFAGICLLLKKSLFLAKLAIYVSSLLGLGGAFSALSSFGGAGAGFGSFANAFGGGLGQLAAFGPGVGHIPGKTSVYGSYDELHHNEPPPYKRADRKLQHEQPRDYVAPRSTPATAAPELDLDRFYDYEKQVLLQERSPAKQRSLHRSADTGSTLNADVYGAQQAEVREEAKATTTHKFRTSDSYNGWQVVDLRV